MNLNDYCRTKDGEFFQIEWIDDDLIFSVDKVYHKDDIEDSNEDLHKLIRKDDYLNGQRVYLSKSGGLYVNGHTILGTNIEQLISSQKFYSNCYSPKDVHTDFFPLHDFPDYSISKTGLVKYNKTGKILSLIKSNYMIRVPLKKGSRIYRISLAELLLDTFVSRKDNQAVVFKDGNALNCILSNLEWSKPEPTIVKTVTQKSIQKLSLPDDDTDFFREQEALKKKNFIEQLKRRL